MKKISLLLVVFIMFSMVSCVRKTDGAGGSSVLKTEVEFSAQYVRTDGYQEFGDYPYISVIHSVEELEAYTKEQDEIYHLETDKEYIDACVRYDSSYFEDQILIFVLLEEPSGSNRHKVTAVSMENEKNMIIEIETIVPEWGDDDMAEWHIMIEPKENLDITEDDITIILDGKINQ